MIDLTHAIPRHDVRAGALVLRGALALPARRRASSRSSTPGSARRRARAARGGAAHGRGGPAARRPRQRPADGRRRAPRRRGRGGRHRRSPERLEPVSRDLPRPRHLRAGRRRAGRAARRSRALGEPLDAGRAARARAARGARRRRRRLVAHVLRRRRLRQPDPRRHARAARRSSGCELGEAVRSQVAGAHATAARYAAHLRRRRARASCCSTRTRAAWLALAVNRGSAAELLGAGRDDELAACGPRDERTRPTRARPPARAPAPHRLDQRARARAGDRRAPRTARS